MSLLKWIPYLGYLDVPDEVVAFFELDPLYDWKAFAFRFNNTIHVLWFTQGSEKSEQASG